MSENDSEQQVKIGKKLQSARQAKGYTLDDLQQITKIQKRYLIAIEDEKFDELPGDFYVRAFIKQYANTVGLNGEELLREYDDDLPKTKTAEYSDHISQAVETRASQRKTVSNGVSKARQYLPTVIIACVIIVVLAAIWVTAIARSHRDNSTRIDNSSVSVSGESKKHSSSVKKKAAPKKTSTTIKLKETSRTATSVVYNANKLKSKTNLQFQTSASSVVRVLDNNNTVLNRTLNTNGKASVVVNRDTNSLVITVTNPAATKIKIGNQTINFTNNGRNQNVWTITINFGKQSTSSSSSSSSTASRTSSTVTNNRTTNTTNTGTSSVNTGNRQQQTTTTTPATTRSTTTTTQTQQPAATTTTTTR